MFTDISSWIEDNDRLVEIVALCIVLAILGLWLYSKLRERPLTKPMGPFSTRKAQKVAEESDENRIRSSQMLRFQIMRDAIAKRSVQRRLGRRQAANEKLASQQHLYDLAFKVAPEEERQLERALEAVKDDPVTIHNRWVVIFLNACLLLGDLIIVSTALATADGQLTTEGAWISSIALAFSVWFSGKLLGEGILQLGANQNRNIQLGAVKAVIGLTLLAVLAVGLASLREPEELVTWTALTAAPGLGSTALTLLSTSRSYKVLRAAEGRWELRRAILSWRTIRQARAAKRYASLEIKTRVDLAKPHLEELGVASQAGVSNRLLEKVDGAEKTESGLLSSETTIDVRRESPTSYFENSHKQSNNRWEPLSSARNGHS